MSNDNHVELAERLYVTLHHVGKRMRILDDELSLSAVRFSVLGALAFHPPMTVGELARFEHVRSPSMTRLLRDMERDGQVCRVADPADGRRVLVELTTAGRALVERARNRKIEMFAQVLADQPATVRRAVETCLRLLDPIAHHPELERVTLRAEASSSSVRSRSRGYSPGARLRR